MKIILVTAIWCLFPFLLAAQQIAFVKGSWEELKERAAQEQKGIFVDVYTSWCAPCRKMSATVFTDAAVAEYINTHYVAVQLDAEKEKEHVFFKEYTPSAYPSFYWLDAEGKLLDAKTGYMPADSFLAVSKNAGNSTIAMEWEACRKSWTEGCREPEFVRKYLFEVLPQVRPDDIRPLLNEYLSGLADEQKATAETGRMVLRFTHTIEDDEVFRTLVRYNDVYQRALGFAGIGKQLYVALVRVPMIDRREPARYATDMALLHRLDFPSKNMYLELIEMENRLFDGKYKEGLECAVAITDRYGEEYPYLYSEICYTLIISRFFADGSEAERADAEVAMGLARQAFDRMPSQCTLTYLAAAYAQLGDYKKAYELMTHILFYDGPALSNAVYHLLRLPPRQEL